MKAWVEELLEVRRYKSGVPLEGTGRTISGRDGVVTEGPFADAQRLVSGYIVVAAEDLDEATEIARGHPALQIGSIVEVRPLRDTERSLRPAE